MSLGISVLHQEYRLTVETKIIIDETITHPHTHMRAIFSQKSSGSPSSSVNLASIHQAAALENHSRHNNIPFLKVAARTLEMSSYDNKQRDKDKQKLSNDDIRYIFW